MDEKDERVLRSLGWTDELLDIVKQPPTMTPVDRMFLGHAREALAAAGCSALEFLAANPDLSVLELAKKLNRGASAIGLTIAIYEEAKEGNVVRTVSKDLLVREIISAFPDGWSSEGTIDPAVRIGDWDYKIGRFVDHRHLASIASKIIEHIAIDHPPPNGWKPLRPVDPLIEQIFDRYWPVDAPGAA